MTTRWEKLNQRFNALGIGALPGWVANWAYWNAHLYRLPGAPKVRAQLKYLKREKKYNLDTPIIVFQMGKVGSSSVYDALCDLDLDVPVYHAHVLNRFDVYAEGVRRTRVAPETDLAAIEEGRTLRKNIDRARWKKWALVSLVRLPIPRAISGFFEGVDAYVPDFWTRLAAQEITVTELHETFLRRYIDSSPIHWFDDQVRDVFGIDVYAAPFPHTRGYALYEAERARMLLMRLEDLDRCANQALGEFLGVPPLVLARKNSGQQKAYGKLYQEFMEQLRLEPDYVRAMHSTRYAEHFYTPQELEASVSRWRGPDFVTGAQA
jgi:hypothetical protein